MAKKAKKKATGAAKKAKAKKPAAKKPAAKSKKPKAAAATASTSSATAAAAPAKPLKPLTMKQRLALIRVDPTTGKCPHNLAPETCAFCMSI